MIQQLASGQVIAARFELTQPLAAGHDATTWLAREVGSGRAVVLRFRAAAAAAGERLLASVRHPALLAPLETLVVADAAVRRVRVPARWRDRPAAWPPVVAARAPFAAGGGRARHVHGRGFVHGDVKTANVLLDADGGARLVDFGSAQPIGGRLPTAGSPYSISPERLEGAPATPADDVYAFGVMLYELVSGHPPFYPDLTPERVRNEVPPALSGRPEPPAALRALVARCLAKRPAERPASMRELCEELERCLAVGQEASTTPRRGHLDAATTGRRGTDPAAVATLDEQRHPRPASCDAKAFAAACWSAAHCWLPSRSASRFSCCRTWWPRGNLRQRPTPPAVTAPAPPAALPPQISSSSPSRSGSRKSVARR